MNKRILYLALLLSVSACEPIPQEYNEYYGAGFIGADEVLWGFEHTTPYPFTVPYGEISCSTHPVLGREVWFSPKGYTHESYIPTPINRVALDSLKEANMTSNVPYSIKEGADLSTVIKIGLKLCDEQLQSLNSKSLF